MCLFVQSEDSLCHSVFHQKIESPDVFFFDLEIIHKFGAATLMALSRWQVSFPRDAVSYTLVKGVWDCDSFVPLMSNFRPVVGEKIPQD